ncbi:MAG: SDR family NAD(P)-dependent oxidoreductase [bacterium]|nr:SDR family NAD(P)-dependent oxidoreductase [bacterium]
MDLKLKDKIALITGGSRGIGRATALRFAEEGCKVAICARGQEGLDKTLAELQDLGVETFGTTADVAQKGDTERFINSAAEALGGVDILINNVGGTAGSRDLITSTDEDWQQTFDLNLFHAVRAIRAALPHMQKQNGGSVVTIASISGWKPSNRGAQYGSTKAAEIFLSGALAWELAPHNIRVNTVSPGSLYFPGGGWERFKKETPEDFARFESRELPAGRLGTDFEVADVVVFLASERANWINGAAIPVDGAQGRPNAF